VLEYTIKRLLLIPPTFFLISLVIFLVLNMAPGRPGEQSQVGQGESRDTQAQKESYRIFKEQFNIDKPIMINTRYSLTTERVRDLLSTAYNVQGDQKAKERVRALEKVEDFGNYLVRHLMALLDDPDPSIQRLAAYQMTQASQLSFRPEHGSDASEARAENRVIRRRNEVVRNWLWEDGADATEVEQVKSSWREWWEENRGDYEYSGREKASIFFFDTRFAKYWANLARLDLGVSTVDQRPIMPVIISKLKYSLSLTLVAVLLAYLIAVPIGIYSAVRQNTPLDTVTTVILFILYSLPTFFTGTVYLRLLSEGDPVAWFPTGGFESMETAHLTTLQHLGDIAWHLVLPIVTYTAVALAALSRYARTGVIDVIRADYVRTARAKGLHELVVIIKHAARNGMIPILTLLGSLLPILVSGSVVIEVVFDIPGMGLYLFSAISFRDYNAVMAVLLIASLLTMVGILVSDLMIAFADPRISFD
jgi:peptide/nickel transport system permease protein